MRKGINEILPYAGITLTRFTGMISDQALDRAKNFRQAQGLNTPGTL